VWQTSAERSREGRQYLREMREKRRRDTPKALWVGAVTREARVAESVETYAFFFCEKHQAGFIVRHIGIKKVVAVKGIKHKSKNCYDIFYSAT